MLSADKLVTGIITDMSASGARMGFANVFDLPRRFAVTFAVGGQRVDVHRVGQEGSVVGVQFEPTATGQLEMTFSRLLRAVSHKTQRV